LRIPYACLQDVTGPGIGWICDLSGGGVAIAAIATNDGITAQSDASGKSGVFN
jgi:hypothetical protein